MNVPGYTESNICVPFFIYFKLDVPVLVVRDSSDNNLCPVIIRTNVIGGWKTAVPEGVDVPEPWHLVLTA